MHQADCLLLLHGNFDACREYIPSKFYEYLWAGRPIIALTHQNPQLNQMLLERNNYVAATTEQQQIIAAIETAYHDWQTNQLPISNLPALGVEQAVNTLLDKLGINSQFRQKTNNNFNREPSVFSIIIPTWNNLAFLKI